MEPTIVRVQPEDVSARLAELGVDEEALRAAVMRGQLEYASCTENHPRMFPAIAAWATVNDRVAPNE